MKSIWLFLLLLSGFAYCEDRVQSVVHDSKAHTVTFVIVVDATEAEKTAAASKPAGDSKKIVEQVLPQVSAALDNFRPVIGKTAAQVDAENAASKAAADAQAVKQKAALVTIQKQ